MGIHSDLNKPGYLQIIAPVITAFNKPGVRANPFEVLMAATLINSRGYYWGMAIPKNPEPPSINYGGGGGGCGCKKCSEYCKKSIKDAARIGGYPNPYTTRMATLEKNLNSMDMSRINAWMDWIITADTFYASTNFLGFFTREYKDGDAADYFVREVLESYTHPDAYHKGLIFNRLTDGSGSAATPAVTTITVETALISAIGSYYIIYINDTNAFCIWHDVDFSGALAPSLTPPPGVSYTYLKIDLQSALLPTDASFDYKNQLALAPAWAFAPPTNGGTSDVIITTLTTGSKPASIDMGPAAPWAMSFVDGTAGATLVDEIFEMYFIYSESTDLADRFFMIYDTAGLTTLLYYNLDGAGTFVPPAGLVPDATVAIDIVTADTSTDILNATKTALDGTTLFSTTVSGLTLKCEYLVSGPVTDVEQGTAKLGVNYTWSSELRASDNTLLATGITDDLDFVAQFNTLRVPYEKNLGLTYPFLNSGFSNWGTDRYGSGAVSCKCGSYSCFDIHLNTAGTCCNKPCPQSDSSRYSPGVFLTSPYNMQNRKRYNRPGLTFNAAQSARPNRVIDIAGI